MAGSSASLASRGCAGRSDSAPPGSGWSAGVIADIGKLVGAARFPVVAVVGVHVVGFKVVKDQYVQIVNPLCGISLAGTVGCGGPSQPVPRFVFAAGVDQGVRVGVEQPGRTWPVVAISELGYLQRDNRGLRETLIPADAGLNDPQLDLDVTAEPSDLRTGHQVERTVEAAKRALAIRHQRQVAAVPCEPPRGPKLSERFSPLARPI